MEIDEKEYNELRRNQEKLFCLISQGVEDSWDGYNDAMKNYNEWLKKDKQKEKINSIVDGYTKKLVEYIQRTLPFGSSLNEVGVKEVKDIVEELCIKTLDVIDKDIYEKWANDLMDKIQEIVEEKYPGVDYWIDTGSRVQACIAMLEQFRKDL